MEGIVGIGVGEERVFRTGCVCEHVEARNGHEGAEVFERPGGDHLGVLPVAGPSDTDLGRCCGDVVEELAGVVVFAEVCEPEGCVCSGKMRAIECAREVLGYGSTLRGSRVDTDLQDIHFIYRSKVRRIQWLSKRSIFEHWQGDEIWALILKAQEPGMAKIGGVRPIGQIRRCKNTNDKVSSVRNDCNP